MAAGKTWGLAEAEARRKPDGGYRFITATELCLTWALYREGRVSARAVRVYFAAHEMAARRCQLERGRKPCFQRDELGNLAGHLSEGKVRDALRELAATGLLRFSAEVLAFARGAADLVGDAPACLAAMLAELKNPERPVPVPRRVLRLLAERAGRGLVATTLAHVLRCLRFVRGRGCVTSGLCHPRWVAKLFGVSIAAVKEARARLERDGLLVRDKTPLWVRRRYGSRVSVSPIWGASVVDAPDLSTPKSGPSVSISAPKSGFSDSQLEPSSTYKNQKPARRGPTGLYGKDEELETPQLGHIELEDLRDLRRFEQLFAEATTKGLVDASESSFYDFAALAERAKRVGKNPPAVFASLLRGRRFQFITNEDEDRAVRRIKAFRDGPQPPKPREPCQDELEAARRRELRRQLDELLRREGNLRTG